jgi:hypothetical protein
MRGTQVMLTQSERELLVVLLETALQEMLVEEHRTRTPSFREHLLENEDVARGILTKLVGPRDVIESLEV